MKKKGLSLSTLQGLVYIGQFRLGKCWIIWVSRSLENGFVVIAHINMLTNTDMFIKAQAQSTCYFLQISLHIDLLTRNSTLSKTVQSPQTFILELLRFHIEENVSVHTTRQFLILNV